MARLTIVFLLALLLSSALSAQASDGDRVEIPAAIAAKAGLMSEFAGPGIVERRIPVYGRLVVPPDQQAQLRARFPGVVMAVTGQVGDMIQKGHVLVTIESNESLQNYALRAPISGQIQSRSANVGELTGEQPMFVVINTDPLWLELKVFPGQRDVIQVGQVVRVVQDNRNHESVIATITPANGDQPYLIARASLKNADNHFAPGDLLNAFVVVETVELPLVVSNKALQSYEGSTVVFVQEGDSYEARPLELGRSDGSHTEVLSGLKTGERYVVENSYLVKADLEKSSASHDH